MDIKMIAFLIMLTLFTWMYITEGMKIALVTWSALAGLIIFGYFKSR